MQALAGETTLATAPVAPELPARFRVLNGADEIAWKAAREAVGDSHLLRGTVAARAGLLLEAAEEFRALGLQNPRAEKARLFLEQAETATPR